MTHDLLGERRHLDAVMRRVLRRRFPEREWAPASPERVEEHRRLLETDPKYRAQHEADREWFARRSRALEEGRPPESEPRRVIA